MRGPKRQQHGRPQRPQRPAQHAAAPDCLLIGRNALEETLRCAPARIQRIFVAANDAGAGSESDGPRRADLLQLIKESGIETQNVPRDVLRNIFGSDSHQGFGAVLKQRQYLELKNFINGDKDETHGLVVLLDSINDPHNFGAILRAAECFGAKAVLFSRNRGSGLTPVVTKSASGASELVPLIQVSNLAESAEKLHAAGYWLVGADCGADSQDLSQYRFPEKTALVLGSEGEGLHNLMRRKLDFKVRIGMCGQIDSLNVSQATAVFLGAYRNQHAYVA